MRGSETYEFLLVPSLQINYLELELELELEVSIRALAKWQSVLRVLELN
jgi:hypothetical protein